VSHERILILDFGAQYTQLIARRVRQAGVYCEIHPWDAGDDFIRSFGARGIILSGSYQSAHEQASAQAPAVVFALGVPVLGICYGMQTMAQQLGGRVESGHKREFGYAELRARGHTRLLGGIQDFQTVDGHGMLKVWMSTATRWSSCRRASRSWVRPTTVPSPPWRTRAEVFTRSSSTRRSRIRCRDRRS